MMRMSIAGIFPIALLSITFALAEKTPEGITCRSFALAKKNGALESCKKLWQNAIVTDVGSISSDCTRCKLFLKTGRHAKYFKSPDISTKDIRVLSSDLKNDTLTCALLGKCTDEVFILPTLKFSESSTCKDCKKIVDDVRVLITDNATEATISTYVKSAICVRLPLQVVDICKRTVDTYIKVLIDLIANELDSDSTCASFGLCPGLDSSNADQTSRVYSWINRPAAKGYEFFHSRLAAPKTDPTTCNECINVISRIRDETKDPEFDKMIKDTVKSNLCESFGYFKAMCEAAVSKEVDAMIDGASKLNISDLCVFFKQCDGALSPGLQKMMEDIHMRVTLTPTKPDVKIPVVCEFCEAILNRVISMTVGNKTEEAIRYAFEQVCSILPKKEKNKCLEYVEKYGDVIIRAIVEGAAPKIICTTIGACFTTETPLPPPEALGTSCKLCEVIIDTIYQNLQTNATKEEIINELETVCKYIPYFKKECISLVDAYAAQAIDLIVDGVPSEEVCRTLGFCPKKQTPELGDGCAICEIVFTELYRRLKSNTTAELIEQYLEAVCDWIPATYQPQCRQIIKDDTSYIIELVTKQLPPKTICQQLGICYGNPPRSPRDEKCRICQQIVDFIYTKIEDDATAAEIEETLETVCDYMPFGSFKQECHEYVKAYTPILIDLLVNSVPSSQVCQTIGLCPSSNLVNLICAGGPVAWCESRSSAAMCSKTEFCSAIVWEDKKKPEPFKVHRRPSVIEKYDCSQLATQKERCSNERMMRLCGFQAFCSDFKRPQVEIDNRCRFCKNLVTQRLVLGSSSLDCAIYENPEEKAKCEKIAAFKIPGRFGMERIDGLCLEHSLCDPEVTKTASPSAGLSIHRILGDDPCLWGPSVTCRDADIAARCGATAYCQQKVWKSPSLSGSVASQPSRVVPGVELVDCSLPPAEICPSPSLRFCGEGVLEKCRQHAGEEEMLRHEMCKDRPVSFCSDEKMVNLCGMGEYCEAMGRKPTPAAPIAQEEKEPEKPEAVKDPRCSHGPAFTCQNYKNAVLCGQVEMCKKSVWGI